MDIKDSPLPTPYEKETIISFYNDSPKEGLICVYSTNVAVMHYLLDTVEKEEKAQIKNITVETIAGEDYIYITSATAYIPIDCLNSIKNYW